MLSKEQWNQQMTKGKTFIWGGQNQIPKLLALSSEITLRKIKGPCEGVPRIEPRLATCKISAPSCYITSPCPQNVFLPMHSVLENHLSGEGGMGSQ